MTASRRSTNDYRSSDEGFRVEERSDTRTKPVFYDSRNWLKDRPGYHNIEQSDFDRPERWEGDVDISVFGRFDYIDGQHVRKGVGRG